MGVKVKDFGYIFLYCRQCGAKTQPFKIAKNKGNYWKIFGNFFEEFLLWHSDCDANAIEIKFLSGPEE